MFSRCKKTNNKLEEKIFYAQITAEQPCWGLESIVCGIPIEHLFNMAGQESTTYIDLKRREVVVYNDNEELTLNCIRIPNLEWFAPYNEVLREFLDDTEVPQGITASQYLKKTGRYSDFCNYRIQKAKEVIDTRLAAFGLRIVIGE